MTNAASFQNNATVQRALAHLNSGDLEAARTTFLETALPDSIVERVNAILLTRLKPIPGIYFHSMIGAKVRFSALPKAMEILWKSIAAGKEGALEDERLFTRVKIAAIKNLVYPARSSLERYPVHAELIFSYLDIRELCRTAACSSQLRDQLSRPNPQIWTHVAATFPFPPAYWPEYSKEMVRKSFGLLRRSNQTFSQMAHQPTAAPFDNFSFRALLVEFSKKPAESFVFRSNETRHAFIHHTLPTIKEIIRRSPTPGHHFDYFITCAKTHGLSSTAIAELFFAAGEKGNKSTLRNVINGLCTHSQNLAEQFHVIELVAKQAHLPDSFDPLLSFFQTVPQEKVMPLLLHLIEKGVKAGSFSLRAAMCYNAPLELFHPLVEKASAEPSVEDFHLLLKDYGAMNPQRVNVTDVMKVMDLFFNQNKFCEEALVTKNFSDVWPDIFRLAAKFKSLRLMDKIKWHCIKPDNSDGENNTLSRAIAERMSLDEIAMLKLYGAQPCKRTWSLIQAYSPDIITRRDLFYLLSQ